MIKVESICGRKVVEIELMDYPRYRDGGVCCWACRQYALSRASWYSLYGGM